MKGVQAILLFLACVLFVCCAWYSLGRRVVRGERYSPYSTYRSDPTGTRRLYLFYEQAGLEVSRLKRELLMLEEEGLLFIIEPENRRLVSMMGQPLKGSGMFIRQELDAIKAWVSEGNSLVLVSRRQTNLHSELGVRVETESTGGISQTVRVQLSHLTKSVPGLKLRRAARLRLESPSWVELFSSLSELGTEPVLHAAVRGLGDGKVVVISDPYILANNGLTHPLNLAFAARLADLSGSGKVYFDEFHHGFSDPRTLVSYIRIRGLHFALLQALFVFGLIIWRTRSRLGRPLSISSETERGSAEYVRAFSLIYRRARLHGSVMRSAFELFREKVALWSGLNRMADSGEIHEVLKNRNEAAAARFWMIKNRAGAAGLSSGNSEVLTFMKLISRFEKEYLNAGRRDRKT